jgi:transcriptional regulator with XRE-family HTH domain
MASEAYLNALNSIPKDIQKEVLSSINIASEIHFALKEKGMCSADLARLMGKSESEISKWLTGLHNFTFKTINKIELALDVDIILTKSDRVQEYENKIIELNKKISDLKDELTV